MQVVGPTYWQVYCMFYLNYFMYVFRSTVGAVFQLFAIAPATFVPHVHCLMHLCSWQIKYDDGV